MDKKLFSVSLVLCLLALLTACTPQSRPAASEAAPTAAVPSSPAYSLGLSAVSLSATTWSSPNGATVHLRATPDAYIDGQSASFLVRLEGADIARRDCVWDGSAYTASVDLNGADGYCYYVLLTNPDGSSNEITVNSPTAVTNEPLINLENALSSFCSASVYDYLLSDESLVLSDGLVQVQTPRLYSDGAPVTCTEAQLILILEGAELGRQSISLSTGSGEGLWEQSIAGLSFSLPSLADEQKLDLLLEVPLSNGQLLSAPVCSWLYMSGSLTSSVG